MNGLRVLEKLKKLHSHIKVLVVTGDGDKDTVQSAFALGAESYILKPLSPAKILAAIKEVLSRDPGYHFSDIATDEPKMAALLEQLIVIAKTDASIILKGESGTGKELLARTIHNQSRVAEGPYITVNCPAIPEGLAESELFGHIKGSFTGASQDRIGKFEAASGGTIFLDEVAELPISTQVKLLRVIQEGTIEPLGSNQVRQVDVRIVCASHKDLRQEVVKGNFRHDLYYRLAEFELRVPSLSERKVDIPKIARKMVAQYCSELKKPLISLSDDVLEQMISYSWPGNIRELCSLIKKLIILNKPGKSSLSKIPPHLLVQVETSTVPQTPLEIQETKSQTLVEIEKAAIKVAIEQEKHNLSRVAQRLGIGRTTLYRKLKAHGIPYARNKTTTEKFGGQLDSLSRTGFFKGVVQSLKQKSDADLESFLTHASQQLEEHYQFMLDAANRLDWPQLGIACGSFKTLVASLDASDLDRACAKLIEDQSNGKPHEIFASLERVRQEINKVQEVILVCGKGQMKLVS
ncbi:two-component system, NtrC family, response regulator HydG/two-component system, NtrC family, response regulator AtoC/two-component system, NtrC family, nitrogen regulation response regulator NtrX [Pseudobacteriovorax antillogorgiicola]|uniref:Two-component system, NtrC family, response regulator HydG/two-component system, NtrC family, response regulator AtoC/two-component system, NtrC family, nitrogen regulation response regulator NtrX n=2 Tax=Pseudobacteriovorax antillogorgiicola TaxID=1513793 RepID=A0A1Y6CMI1_9BACT|nr:two-component system response regulator HydG/two-component system response regulator AtoC/two-component system nitrogen regulation response regulator NtrX [Pseudobacteriovorax antillogorgiicola]SMF62732.1 two-component system, NtrC family, response regulator HydG/two-component system, NtrC family, response regulator AtoC/two-component system, NtrC family, nitrogen regulation response regulator NtrX [Pseudobacteriovorax antillogorgiicola]